MTNLLSKRSPFSLLISADVDQLVELRARQRTSNGAFTRTTLGYSLAVPRLFNRFGLYYCMLFADFVCVCALLRGRYSRHDFADNLDNDTASLLVLPTVGHEHGQSFWRPFVTAGRIIALVACVVAVTELALLALFLRLRLMSR
ncbi:hypothetical protein EDB85DRAFT_1854007 [Lactarius pseudohatsudake]|nr:hypothetical protein EDB85DRAFT_1854007 [Lactarius pseudohatsudake]